MPIGILIGRLNPPHIGHMRILDESLTKNKKTIIFLGSSNICDDRNPFSFEKRKELIIDLYGYNEKLLINNLDDFESDKDWVLSLKQKLENYIIEKNEEIIFYCGDFLQDYAIIVLKKYIDLLGFTNILFKEISRKSIKINNNNDLIEISSTIVREAIKNKDNKLLEKFVDKKIINKIL